MATWTAPGLVSQSRRQLGLRNGLGVLGQGTLEPLERFTPPRFVVLRAKPGEDPCEQRQGPIALEEPFGCLMVRRLAQITSLRVPSVDRQWHNPTPAFGGSITLAAVSEEGSAIGQKKRAGPPLGRVSRGDRSIFQKLGEVALRQVESVIGPVSFAADESVERKPVSRAEVRERLASLGRITIPGGNDATPSRCRKAARRAILRHRVLVVVRRTHEQRPGRRTCFAATGRK